MKPKIKVFPDYCSSGLWEAETGVNLSEHKFEDLLGKSNLLALKYWHCLWEFNIACFADNEQPKASERFIAEWNEDGKELVKQFNLCQDQFEFIYEEH